MKLTPKIAYQHINEFGQYSQVNSWAKWYSQVAPIKGKRVAKLLLNYKSKNSKLLDFGCGTGMTFAVLTGYFSKSIGVDVGQMEIKATKSLLKRLKLKSKAVLYDGKKLPFPDNSFDIVTSIEVIEHVDQMDRYLKETRRVLKPDGILHITTANKYWIIEPHFKLPFLAYLPPKFADIYVKISGRGDSYQNIHLPSFGQFKSLVSRYFDVDDVTFDVIKNYKHFNLNKERGGAIKIIANILNFVPKPLLSLLSWFSLGWLFIATPKK